MAYNAKDYANDTYAARAADQLELIALGDREDEERRAAFLANEARECAEADAAEALYWAAQTAPVHAAVNGWLKATAPRTTPRYAAIGNGLFVRLGDGKRKRRAA